MNHIYTIQELRTLESFSFIFRKMASKPSKNTWPLFQNPIIVSRKGKKAFFPTFSKPKKKKEKKKRKKKKEEKEGKEAVMKIFFFIILFLLFTDVWGQGGNKPEKKRGEKRKREVIEEVIVETDREALEADPFLWLRNGGTKGVNTHFRCHNPDCNARKSFTYRTTLARQAESQIKVIVIKYRGEHLPTCQRKRASIVTREEVIQAKEQNIPLATILKNGIVRRLKNEGQFEQLNIPETPYLQKTCQAASPSPSRESTLVSLRSLHDLAYRQNQAQWGNLDEIGKIMKEGKGFVRSFNVLENRIEIFMIADEAIRILSHNLHEVYHLNGTHSVVDANQLGEDYQLLTLLVRTSADYAQPLAHMITKGRDALTYSRFLKLILESTNDLWGNSPPPPPLIFKEKKKKKP